MRYLVIAVAAAVAAALAVAAAAATRPPIRVMTISPAVSQQSNYPEILETARVWGKWVNDNGGIKGRPVEVLTCDDHNDPNAATACARQAVARHAVALVGNYSLNADKYVPILERAQLPDVAPCCPTPREGTSPIVFNAFAGALNTVGLAAVAGKYCKRVGAVSLDLGAYTDFFVGLGKGGLKAEGKELVGLVKVAPVATDVSPQVAQLANSNPDCVLMLLTKQLYFSVLGAMKQAGLHWRVFGAAGNLDSELVKAYPDLTENAVGINIAPLHTDARWAVYRAAWAKYSKPSKFLWEGYGPLATWIGYVIFKSVAETVQGPLTSASLTAALRKASHVETGGLLPTLDFTKEWAVKGFNRYTNRSFVYYTVRNHQLVPLDGNVFHDVTEGFFGKPFKDPFFPEPGE